MTNKQTTLARPLMTASGGEVFKLDSVRGSAAIQSRLAALGFVPGAELKLMHSHIAGSVVVAMKESRLVLGYGMAQYVWVR
jgi:Fe2+ transport system protein FeoA